MRRTELFVILVICVPTLAALGQGLSDDLLKPFTTQPGGPGADERFSARAIVSHRTVRPGDSLHVAVEMNVAEKWWVYGPVAGGKIVPAQDLTIKSGETPLKIGKVLFSATKPHVSEISSGQSDTHNVYEGRAYAFVPVTVPAAAQAGRYRLPLTIAGQLCTKGVCAQLETAVSAEIEVGEAVVASSEWTQDIQAALAAAKAPKTGEGGKVVVFGEVKRTTLGWLGVAVLAGLIINILPCVLPVIPLRLLALLNQARQSRGRFVTLGLAFAGGVFLFFAAIAAANVLLKVIFAYNLVWGDFFRHTELVIAMSLLLVILAANMFGAFTVTLPGRVASAEAGRGHLGAGGMGFLMGVLSTPCSAAIIASVFVWAQVQPLWLGTLSILLMGAGMALPHVVLAALPGIVSKIPRAGRWSELFKQSVGFVFLGIAVWLLSTRLGESAYVGWAAGYAVILAFAAWMWGSWLRFDSAAWKKWSVRGAAAAVTIAAGFWMLRLPAPPVEGSAATRPAAKTTSFVPFDAAEIARARAAGQTVLVEFTASWCLECLVVEKRIYQDAEVIAQLTRRNILTVKGDVTDRSMPANEMLYKQLGQVGPPITAILPPGDGNTIILRGIFSKEDFFKALAAAQNEP